MKTFKPLIGVLTALVSFNALADGSQKYARFPLPMQVLAKEVERCAYQPTVMTRYGRKRYGNMQSRCATLVIDGRVARLQMGREVFTLELRDSPISDGDFGDLSIFDSHSRLVFQAKNLLAYGDVLFAVVGETSNPDSSTTQGGKPAPVSPMQQPSNSGRF